MSDVPDRRRPRLPAGPSFGWRLSRENALGLARAVLASLALVFMHDNRGDVRLSFVFFAVDLPLIVVIGLFTALGALAGGGTALRLARRRVLRRRGDA